MTIFLFMKARPTLALVPTLALAMILGLTLAAPPVWAEDEASILADLENGYRAHQAGQFDRAIEYYTKVVRAKSLTARDRATAYVLRGEVYRDQGEHPKAIADLSRALKLRPAYPHALFIRGLCHEVVGQDMEAYKDLKQAVAMRPTKESYVARLAIVEGKLKAKGVSLPGAGPATKEEQTPPSPSGHAEPPPKAHD